jgi:hypothetical protein
LGGALLRRSNPQLAQAVALASFRDLHSGQRMCPY